MLAFSAWPAKAQKASSALRVELADQARLRLRLTLRPLAKTPATIYKSDLPWELRHSIILVAVLPNGEELTQNVVVDDPPPGKISV